MPSRKANLNKTTGETMRTLLMLSLLTLPMFTLAQESYCGDDTYAGASLCDTQQSCSAHCSSMDVASAWVTYPGSQIPPECHCGTTSNERPILKDERKQESYHW